MSKAAFIELVAKKGSLSKAEAKRTVDLVFDSIEAGLKAGKDKGYVIGGFGSFKISKRGARKGRNPRTGEEIKIKASKTLRFKPAANLKKAAGV
jgi:DNA-binding protein HU-beta